ncbi:hypothetical protein ACFE04_022797 [Oxalis oulophora]
MAPTKLNLGFIEIARTRKACYKNRCNSLIQKVVELFKLCSVVGFIIMYNHDDPRQIIAHPSDFNITHQLIRHYESYPNDVRNKNMCTQETHLSMGTEKEEKKICKMKNENKMSGVRELKYKLYHGLKSLNDTRKHERDLIVEYNQQKIKQVKDNIEYLEALQRLNNRS